MSLSNPNNPPLVNEAVAQPVSTGFVFGVDENQTKINQLHGIAGNNTIGAGIPKQVTNIQVSVANAQTGSTCTVSVLFKQDPTDKNFSGVNVWVKGYQGNSNPVQIGSGTASPTKIVLNNTGETVSFVIQAYGNGGNAPFSQAPTCSGTLPKSTAGGFGSSTVVSPLTSLVMPSEFNVNQTGASITVGKTTQTAGTVWAGPKNGSVAQPSFRPLTVFDIPSFLVASVINSSNAGSVNSQFSSGCLYSEAFNTPHTFVTATSIELPYMNHSSGAGASTNATVWGTDNQNGNISLGYGFPVALLQLYSITGKINSTSNIRCFLGVGGQTTVNGGQAAWANDAPTNSARYIQFRYSAGTDTHWKGVACDGVGSQVVVDLGVTPDTNVHRFRFEYDGTTVTFFIDDILVGSLSISFSSAIMVFNSIDNKNTANVASFSWNNFFYVLKR